MAERSKDTPSNGFRVLGWLRISILIRAVWTCNHLTRPPQPSCSKPSSRSRNPPCLCSLSTSPPQPSLPFSAPKTLSRPLSQQGALDLSLVYDGFHFDSQHPTFTYLPAVYDGFHAVGSHKPIHEDLLPLPKPAYSLRVTI